MSDEKKELKIEAKGVEVEGVLKRLHDLASAEVSRLEKEFPGSNPALTVTIAMGLALREIIGCCPRPEVAIGLLQMIDKAPAQGPKLETVLVAGKVATLVGAMRSECITTPETTPAGDAVFAQPVPEGGVKC